MDKNYIDAISKNKNVFTNKRLNIAVFLVAILVSAIPLIIGNETDIKNNEELRNSLDYLSSIFTRFEELALLGEKYNLYYFIKLQLSWSFISFLFVFIVSLFFMSKIYYFSLNPKEPIDKSYFDAIINTNKSNSSFLYWLFCFCIYILILNLFLFHDIISFHDENPIGLLKLVASTKLGSFIYCIGISMAGFIKAYLIIELIALIKKQFNKMK